MRHIQQDLDIVYGGKSKLEIGEEVIFNKGKPIVILLKINNQSSIALAYNPVFYSETKHIDIQHHYICDEVAA